MNSEPTNSIKITDFFQLNAWKISHELVIEIYKITKNFPPEEKYAIIDQMRRAVTSISANIAEGFGRFHYNDRIHFYHQSRGSVKEVQDFLLISKDLNYINAEQLKPLWELSKSSEKLINGLIRSSETMRNSHE